MKTRAFKYPVFWLMALAVLVYLPAITGGFVWDDDNYVTDNPQLRTIGGLWRIWTQLGATAQYYPMVFSSFWAEYHLWGLNPVGYHLVNALLHGLSGGLLYLILRRLGTRGIAAATAVIFVVHPVMIESVQWITERKNVLSLAFALSSLWMLLPAADAPSPGAAPTRTGLSGRRYALALALFVCALLSKTVACTLPAVFLVVCWYKDGRGWVRRLPAMVPFFVIGLALAAVTVYVERRIVGTDISGTGLSPLQRVMLAGRILWFYAGKLLWPWPTMFVYPRWEPRLWGAVHLLWPAAVGAVLVTAWALRRRWGRGPAALLFIYAGCLVPALGFVDVYPFEFSFVADHFVYMAAPALLAFYVAAARLALLKAGIMQVQPAQPESVAAQSPEPSTLRKERRRPSQKSARAEERRAAKAAMAPPVSRPVIIIVAVVALVLTGLTIRQARAYMSAETLYRDAITKNPTAAMPLNNLGQILALQGNPDQAEAYYRRAIEVKPDFAGARFNLGEMLLRKGQTDAARQEFDRALSDARPGEKPRLWFHVGLAWARQKDADAAIAAFKKAAELKPEYVDPLVELGNVYGQTGHPELAVDAYEQALTLRQDNPLAHANMGIALAQLGHNSAAQEHFKIALRLDPSDERTRQNLAHLVGTAQ